MTALLSLFYNMNRILDCTGIILWWYIYIFPKNSFCINYPTQGNIAKWEHYTHIITLIEAKRLKYLRPSIKMNIISVSIWLRTVNFFCMLNPVSSPESTMIMAKDINRKYFQFPRHCFVFVLGPHLFQRSHFVMRLRSKWGWSLARVSSPISHPSPFEEPHTRCGE